MSDKKEILDEYMDVIIWLATLGLQDILKLQKIQEDAISITAKHFNQSFEYVKSLVAEFQFQYSKDEEPIARFFHEYLRKIRDSHQ